MCLRASLCTPEVVARVCSPHSCLISSFATRAMWSSHMSSMSPTWRRATSITIICVLPDFNSRLNVSILGRPNSSVEFPDIAGRFAPYLGWLDHPEVLTIHFEDLIENRAATLACIMDHFLARVPLQVPRPLNSRLPSVSAVNPNRSPTFRSGKTGEWKKYFTEQHKKVFKEVAGSC